MAEIEKKWYVLRAISGKEAKVKEYLEADIKNSDLGEYVSQVLIPTEKVYQVRNGKKIVKERSYLPGYVLVEAALVGEVSHHLRNTPNVIGFLGGSEKPVPLRQSEVNRILGTVDELQETGEELNIPYVVGETVKVTFGPFSGFSGIIEEVNSEKKKLKGMVKIFGRKTPLELGFKQVEKELSLTRKAKKEVVRDLNEVFASALEHGETEQQVIERLGTPKEFAENTAEQLGIARAAPQKRKGIISSVAALVVAVAAFVIYATTQSGKVPDGAIGQADAMTNILVEGAFGFDASQIILAVGVIAVTIAIIQIIRTVRKNRR